MTGASMSKAYSLKAHMGSDDMNPCMSDFAHTKTAQYEQLLDLLSSIGSPCNTACNGDSELPDRRYLDIQLDGTITKLS